MSDPLLEEKITEKDPIGRRLLSVFLIPCLLSFVWSLLALKSTFLGSGPDSGWRGMIIVPYLVFFCPGVALAQLLISIYSSRVFPALWISLGLGLVAGSIVVFF